MREPIYLSVVVPFFNEEQSVSPLCDAVAQAVEPLEVPFEVLLVDDGSTDGTFEQARQVAERNDRFRVIKLRRNFGQTAALAAGIQHTQGQVIVTMDGDLQNDPRDIEVLLDKMREGYDVVIGWREQRKDKMITRRIPSIIANWIIRVVMGTSIRDNGCAIRAYRADMLRSLPLYSEMHRLLPTIMVLAGARLAQVKVRHHSRKFGSSKYGLSRIYKVMFDMVALKTILSLVRLPLFGFGVPAVIFALFSTLAVVAGIVQVVTAPESPIVFYMGAALLWGSLSMSMLMLGVLCDLIYRREGLKVESLLKKELV